MDKAGSYGIQDWMGYIGVRKMEGDFFNVMGLPLHKLYRKIISLSKKYHAHDEKNEYKVGDTVSIIETRPYSKLKTWTVISSNEANQ